jgi:hypothetical protein
VIVPDVSVARESGIQEIWTVVVDKVQNYEIERDGSNVQGCARCANGPTNGFESAVWPTQRERKEEREAGR